MKIISLSFCFRDRGKPWDTTGRSNKYKKVKLSRKDTAEFYFKQLIAPPTSNLACLDFRFKKFASGKSQNIYHQAIISTYFQTGATTP